MEFLNSLKKRSKHYSFPFHHWELNGPLTQDAINEICKTEIIDLKDFLNYLNKWVLPEIWEKKLKLGHIVNTMKHKE